MLVLEDIRAAYGPIQALFGVNLRVEAGEVVALMGRNGMGKSTTIRAILRLIATEGTALRFLDQDLMGLPPHRAARLGLGLVPEGRRCFPNLTVAENLAATARPGAWDRRAVEALFPRLAERRAQMAETLSGGEQQMLAIGRALLTNPKLLILDEATEGLAPTIRTEIWASITALKQRGQSILIVDKSLKELLPLADRCVILERGRDVWSGGPQDLSPEIADRYLGV